MRQFGAEGVVMGRAGVSGRCGVRAAVGFVLASLWAGAAMADPGSECIVQSLRESSQFRVRAQAALALGKAENSAEVLAALTLSLQDEHPAVRAAAARALGMLGDPRALDALREAVQDREALVRLVVRGAITKLEEKARVADSSARVAARSRSGG